MELNCSAAFNPSSRDTLLAANNREGVGVFHNVGRPIPPACLCAQVLHTADVCLGISMNRRAIDELGS